MYESQGQVLALSFRLNLFCMSASILSTLLHVYHRDGRGADSLAQAHHLRTGFRPTPVAGPPPLTHQSSSLIIQL